MRKENWKRNWKKVKNTVRNINSLIEKAEKSNEVDLEKAGDLIQHGVEDRIEEKLVGVESFLREVIKKAKM